MYLDGGHAGWLGWPANLQPAADLFGKLYADAGKPSQLRGMAVSDPLLFECKHLSVTKKRKEKLIWTSRPMSPTTTPGT